MSDTPIEDWWQAKDGRWYPPETHPSVAGGPVAPPAGWARRADGTWGPTPSRSETPPLRPADINSTMSSAATEAPQPTVSFGHLADQAFRPAPFAAPTQPDREVTVVRVERRRPSPRALVAVALVLIAILAGAGWLTQRDDGTTPVIDDADRVATTSRPARGTTSTTTYVTTTAMAVTSAPSAPLVPESTAAASTTTTTSTTASGSRRRTTTTVKSSPATVPKSTPTAAPPATPTPTDPPATTPPTTAPPATTAAPTTSPTTTSPEPTIPDP